MTPASGVTWFYVPAWDRYSWVAHGFFTRVGGVSPPPYSSLNVGLKGGDSGEIGRVAEEARAWLASRPDVVCVEPVGGNGEGHLRITFAGDDEVLAQILRELVDAGFPVVTFREETGDLEDVFMRLTKGVVS